MKVRRRQRDQRLLPFVMQALRGGDHDHTRGPIRRSIGLLAIPMMLELLMEAVFAVVDIFFVGRLGAGAVAAVGLTEAVLTLVYAVAIGMTAATTAMVARRIGENDSRGAAVAAGQALWIGTFISIAIGAFGIVFGGQILRWVGADEAVVAEGAIYTRILLGGSATITYIFLINAIFRGAGDASIAMRALWLANGINLVLDPVLIFGLGPAPELGIMGAAIATTIGRGTGVLYQLWMLHRGRLRVRLRLADFVIVPVVMRRLLVLSANGIAQYFIAVAAWIFLMSLVARSGTAAVAGYTIALRVIEFVILPAWGLSNAVATMVGQALGAGKPSRAQYAILLTARYNFAFLVAVGTAFIAAPELFVRIFSPDPLVLEFGAAALRYIAFGYGLYAIGMVLMQALNGAGDTRTPMLINLVCFWLIQIPLAWMLEQSFGARGVYVAIVVAESLTAVFAYFVVRRGTWKQVAL